MDIYSIGSMIQSIMRLINVGLKADSHSIYVANKHIMLQVYSAQSAPMLEQWLPSDVGLFMSMGLQTHSEDKTTINI